MSSLFEPELGPVIVASFDSDGDCDCGDSIITGDRIRADGQGGWVHATCPMPTESDARAAGRLCPRCFCLHAGEC